MNEYQLKAEDYYENRPVKKGKIKKNMYILWKNYRKRYSS